MTEDKGPLWATNWRLQSAIADMSYSIHLLQSYADRRDGTKSPAPLSTPLPMPDLPDGEAGLVLASADAVRTYAARLEALAHRITA